MVGNITKEMLDNERTNETNTLDMMQNSSIIYHTESLLEMQILCLVVCFVLNRKWKDNLGYGVSSEAEDHGMTFLGNTHY